MNTEQAIDILQRMKENNVLPCGMEAVDTAVRALREAQTKRRKIVVTGTDNEVLAVIAGDTIVEKNGVSVIVEYTSA